MTTLGSGKRNRRVVRPVCAHCRCELWLVQDIILGWVQRCPLCGKVTSLGTLLTKCGTIKGKR